ncbi:DUF1993 domain-containing protein [Pseudoduganella namucuonensis]|uniref:DUF1993 family protein n=1 Tax=Pseudoduganella namucuonensis TaxID=1035707 RepID=A0A1I7L9M9_9BURK|nr:DUF1993 domain-containing protein [Pseudoduganella namucuonensis]SFV06472.1 hypothetical protein SAMN05216552_102558 [Pseudoduganella namucuonensis]
MSLTMYQASIPAFVRALNVLSALLTKGEEHAAEHGIVPEILLGARLADDMMPLTAQVQRVSDAAKLCIARLTGVDAPKFEDNETSFQQLRERIAKTVAFLEGLSEAQFEGSDERDVTLTFGAFSQSFTGQGYLLTFALPNFYFHVTTAYGILRAQGVKIGKLDFLGPFN